VNSHSDFFTHQFDDVLILYAEVCDWFSHLGFNYSKNRYGIYKKYFERFQYMKDKKSFDSINEGAIEFKRSFDNAYIEMNEIIRIYNCLKYIDSNEFLEQMKKVSSGQEFRASSNNDPARDFLFELSVACRFIKAGYKVSLNGICDVVVDLNNDGILFVECKRIKSASKIDKNVKKANKQIVTRIKGYKSSKVKGLVAINVTDLLPKNNMFITGSVQESTDIHRNHSNSFIRKNLEQLSLGMQNKSLGLMCESASMYYFLKESDQGGYTYSRHTEFLSYFDSPLFEKLVPELSSQDIK